MRSEDRGLPATVLRRARQRRIGEVRAERSRAAARALRHTIPMASATRAAIAAAHARFIAREG